jgi:kinesin family protein 6/9
LEQVIIALSDKKRDHVPYRQSKLTTVLRDALGGNCNTLLIANIWGEEEHIEETISTLRFATRMSCVSTNPQMNVQYDPLALLKKYEREIRELKMELSMHDTLSNKSHVQYEPFSETQKLELMKGIRGYVDGEVDEIEVINLRQIRELFSGFRSLVKHAEQEAEDRGILNTSQGTVMIQSPPATSSESKNFGTGDVDGVGDMEGGGFGIGTVID